MPQTRAAGGAAPQPPTEPVLPTKFTNIRVILDESVAPGRFVNVIGVVKDCQLPIATSGKDHKCTLTLYDLSIEDEQYGLKFIIFRPECDMPRVEVGDVIIAESVKVQRYQANPLSLISNQNTSVRVYEASKIPHPPEPARIALAVGSSRDKYAPGPAEHAFVSYLYHKISKYSLPDEHEFRERTEQSLNVKKKFSLLKDVQEGKFYDLIVRVATEPYIGFDLATLYVSDYTENPNFHPQVWQGISELGSAAGDPYGYTSSSPALPKREWVGPYGKMAMQISCYEPHASIVREEVAAGSWVALRNVQIKFGRDGRFLEGYMREERNSVSTKVNVHVLETKATDGETADPNLKEALRRCRDYERRKKKQLRDIGAAHAAGLKRKASKELEEPALNAKARRKLKRAASGQERERQEKEKADQEELRLGLNNQISCEAHDAPFLTIETILKPTMYETAINGQPTSVALPFTDAKYLARARVVDFFPHNLEDFACSRRPSEYELLSDNEDDSDSLSASPDEDEENPAANCAWEWRFALQLEDPRPHQPVSKGMKSAERPRLWVLVGNNEGQCLTGLDAADLRKDSAMLAQLCERMTVLWGNLQELKAQASERKRSKDGAGRQAKTGRGGRTRFEKPPLESDGEGEGEDGDNPEAVSNKPFSCCIQQYGIYDKDKGTWVRCFGLFGTKIRG